MKAAIDYMLDLIESGVDYSDALFKTSEKFKISHDFLAEEYDRLCD